VCLVGGIRVAQEVLSRYSWWWWWSGCTTAIADALAGLALLQPMADLLSPMAGLGRAGASDVAPTYTYVYSCLSAVWKIDCPLSHHTNTITMRSFFLALFLGLLGFVSALSAAGSNLLVVVDDEADKGKYSTFWSDLTCKQHSRIDAIRHSERRKLITPYSKRLPTHFPRRQRCTALPLPTRRTRLLPPPPAPDQVKRPGSFPHTQPDRRVRQCRIQRAPRSIGRERCP
jgi:hypothetical protein